jgi:hypothetical protein
MSDADIATEQRRRVGTAWFGVEALYVAVITALAVLGMTSDSHRPILLIVTLLALPCGLLGLFGLYVLTALFNEIASGFSNNDISYGGCTGTLHGTTHCVSWGTPVGAQGFWFNFSVVALFTIAALANVLILRFVVRRSRGSSAPPGTA